MEQLHTGQHHVIPLGGEAMMFYGVWTNDRMSGDGSDPRVTASECSLVITLQINQQQLDGRVVRVGFMGTDNGSPFTIDLPAACEYRIGLWDLLFAIRRSAREQATVPSAAEDAAETADHSYVGSFYAETSTGAYYWLKYGGESDFMFDYASLPTIASLTR